jgi:phospholipid-binding lipoprotein MlaA
MAAFPPAGIAMTHRSLLLALFVASAPALAAETDAAPEAVTGAAAAEVAVATDTAAAGPAPDDTAAGPVATASAADPWEGFNRKVYRFNDVVDRNVAKPVAKGYVRAVPRPLRSGITNFFRNLKMPVVMLNDLLQAKPRAAGQDLSRFLVNSTLGFVGFVDVASKLDVARNDEDFGQTLGVWGVPNGPYLVLPFLGPSTVRDTGGFAVDVVTDPVTVGLEEGPSALVWSVKFVNTRANLLDVEEIIQGDRYLFLRDLYLQSRAFAVKDGVVESDPFLDEEEPSDEPTADTPASAGPDTSEEGAAGAGDEASPAPAGGDGRTSPVQDEPATDGGE